MQNLLSKIFKAVFPFEDFLYILQLEEYDNLRFAKQLPRFFLLRNLLRRDTLKYTSRVQTTLMLSIGIYILSLVMCIFFPFFIFISEIFIPVYIFIANNLLTPFYEIMKYRLQKKASKFVQRHNNLKIIGIAGSYGKTTTKNFLYELIRYNFKAQMVPGNINTPTGIAAWVLKELNSQTEILLVEMDTYFIGEIARSCMVTPPDIAIITSIGDQHVERFGSRQKLARAIMEIFEYSKEGASLYAFDTDMETLSKLHVSTNRKITKIKTSETKVKTNIKSKSAKTDLHMAISVAQEIGISSSIIADTVKHLNLPDRRQKPTTINGFDAIDDSYNISATTAREGVLAAKQLASKTKKKLIVVTAGIPELGPDSLDENKKYGKFLSKNADEVIVLKSIFYKDIFNEGFLSASNMNEVWSALKNFDNKKYVLLMQPELTDLYYDA